MVGKGIFFCVIIFFFLCFGRVRYCFDDSNCVEWLGEFCCLDYVCRRKCDFCLYDFECGLGEKCCDGGVCLLFCFMILFLIYCIDKSDCD